MFKIVKISKSNLLTVKEEDAPKPAEKKESPKLKKFSPTKYNYQEDKVFMDLEILAASYSKYSDNPKIMSDILSVAKTDPQKAYEIALNGYVEIDHKEGFGGDLEPDEKLKAKRYLGYKLKGAKDTFAECVRAIEDESIGNTFTGFRDSQKIESKAYAELVAGLKRWDKKLKKLKSTPKPEKKEPTKPEKKEPTKPEKKEPTKPVGKSMLLSEGSTISGLVKLANHLDSIEEIEEASLLDNVLGKYAKRTMVFDLDAKEIFDKDQRKWRRPTEEELEDVEVEGSFDDIGDLNPDSIKYEQDGDSGSLEMRDDDGDEIATILVNEPPENEISWYNLREDDEDDEVSPRNMTLPDGEVVTINTITLEGSKMIKELIKLANHLDGKGFAKEADYLDALIKSAGETDDDIMAKIRNPLTNKDKATLAWIRRTDQGRQELDWLIRTIDSQSPYPSYKNEVDELKKKVSKKWKDATDKLNSPIQSGPAASADTGPKTTIRNEIRSDLTHEKKLELWLNTRDSYGRNTENDGRILEVLKTKMDEDKAKGLISKPKEEVLKEFKKL